MNRRMCLSLAASAVLGTAGGCLSGTSTPPDASTPPAGECEADAPPHPSTTEGLPDPKSYPDGPPELEEASVRAFLEEYETAYRYNRRLADIAASDNCLRNLEVWVDEATVNRTKNGFIGEITTKGSHTGATCPGTTETPVPHADYAPKSTQYNITDRFVVRNQTTVACWD